MDKYISKYIGCNIFVKSAKLLPFRRNPVSKGDTDLGLIVKNLLDATNPDTVLRHLPAPLARTARGDCMFC